MHWADAEILEGTVAIEGEIVPEERAERNYPGCPADVGWWRVVSVDVEALNELGVRVVEFLGTAEAVAWIEANCEEQAHEALLREYGEES